MRCYVCKIPCTESYKHSFLVRNITVKALDAHYRIYHDLKEDDKYTCTERDCDRSFSKLNSFRHHFELSHTNQPTTTVHVSSDRLEPDKCSENISKANDTERISTSFKTVDDCPSPRYAIEPKAIDSDSIEYHSIDTTDLALVLEAQLLAFVTKLYDKSTLPRNQVQSIVYEVANFINRLLRAIEHRIINVCNSNNVPINGINEIEQLFETFSLTISTLNTEHVRFKYFRDEGYLIDPVDYTIG